MRPDCLIGVVPQPTDSRLSETSASRVVWSYSNLVLMLPRHGQVSSECPPITEHLAVTLITKTIQIPLKGTLGYHSQGYLNDIWMAFWRCVGIFVPFSGIEWYFKLLLRLSLSPIKISLSGLMVLNDTKWYSMVFRVCRCLFFVGAIRT